jgi:two-component system, sensor histidine kinase and response regulator
MIAECTSCGKKYRVDESKIQGREVRVRCKACGEVILISPPDVPSTPPSPPPEVSPPPEPTPSLSSALEPPTPVSADELTFEETPPEPASKPSLKKKKPPVEGMSIKSKITLVMVLLVLASLTVAGFMASRQSRTALSDQAERHLLQHARQKSREYGIVFTRIKDEVQGVAAHASHTYSQGGFTRDMGIRILMPWTGSGYGSPLLEQRLQNEIFVMQRIGAVLKSIVENNPFLSLGYFGTETKMTVFDKEETVGVIEDLEGFDVTERPWYAKAKEAGKTIWTDPYVDANTKKLVVTCATPVYRTENDLAGVVGFDVLLDTIQKDILTLDIGYRSYAFLAGPKGNVLVRPGMKPKDVRWDATYKTDDLLHTSNPSFNQITRKMVEGGSGIATYSSEEGDRYIAFAPIQAINASMGIVASRDEVVKPADAIQRTIIIIWIVVLAISVLIGLFLGNSITRPINELTIMADEISQGRMDLDVLEETRKDEIGVLTRAFNRLVMSLKLAMSR